MNVTSNSVSSSPLPIRSARASAAPESAYVWTSAVHMIPLDSVMSKMVPAGKSLALKRDPQRCKAAALAGGEGILPEVRIVECEPSIVSLYFGQPLHCDVIDLLDGLGFSLVALGEGLIDSAPLHLLLVDAILVRADGPRPM